MSDRSPTEAFSSQLPQPVPDPPGLFPPLPPWLADRLLRPDETITWVYGPRFNPSWERYVTHPALFVLALAFGVFSVLASTLIAGGSEVPVLVGLAAAGLLLAVVFVLALASGYFTRLVVTNHRLVILQGYEVCRSWRIDEMPRSLIRYRMLGSGAEDRTIDLDALKTMLGSVSDKVVEAKTILTFGKRLDQIRTREDGRP
jgi:hypothetical protein